MQCDASDFNVHTSAPLHASYFSTDYVNMQDNYINMQDKYVNMQDSYVKMQLIYVNMQLIYVNMQDNYVNMQFIMSSCKIFMSTCNLFRTVAWSKWWPLQPVTTTHWIYSLPTVQALSTDAHQYPAYQITTQSLSNHQPWLKGGGQLSRYDRATRRVYWQFISWLYFVITFKETIIVYMK